jgi:peptidoglycan-associated lipoprotein
MSQSKSILVLLLAVGLMFAVGACKKPTPIEPVAPPPVEEKAPPPPPPPVEVKEEEPPPIVIEEHKEPSITELNAQGILKTIYFDLDKYDLTETTRATLRQNADWLRANAGHDIVIEGHCDERGSIEYNLALGERRANAARDFLASLGLGSTNVRIVSFGEERPAVDGHHEGAWSKNRRGEFIFE